MKKLLGLLLLTGSACALTACKEDQEPHECPEPEVQEEVKVELKAGTATVWGYSPHFGGDYAGYAKVTVNAEGKLANYKSIEMDEVVSSKYFNSIQLAKVGSTAISALAADQKVKGTFCYQKGRPAADGTLSASNFDGGANYETEYAKYLKIGSDFYMANLMTFEASKEKCLSLVAGTEGKPDPQLVEYVKVNAAGEEVKVDEKTVPFKITTTNFETVGKDLIANGVFVAKMNEDNTAIVATTTKVPFTKRTIGYGSTSYSYAGHLNGLAVYAVANTQDFLKLNTGTYGLTNNTGAANTELKQITGATGTDSSNYLNLAQRALKQLVK